MPRDEREFLSSTVERNVAPVRNDNAVAGDRQEPDEPDAYADLISVLLIRPHPRAWDSVRVAWLFRVADALEVAGYPADADVAREQALTLVRSAISVAAKGEAILANDR